MYNEEKTAQMAGYFLRKYGQEMNYVKLMKLLYLADRKSLELFGESMSGDSFCSMDRLRKRGCKQWHDWIKQGSKYYFVFLNPEKNDIECFDLLSESDEDILNEVYREFSQYEPFDLADKLHEMCAEWNDPYGSSTHISYEDIFRALGNNDEQSTRLAMAAREKDELKDFAVSMS